MQRISGRPAGAAAVALVVLASCGGVGGAKNAPSSQTGQPSASAKMVCAPEAQKEIAVALQVVTTEPVTPTWADQIFSCRFVYDNATMVLSVKELSNKTATDDYFSTLQQQLGNRKTLAGLGDGAFFTSGESVVVRKDFKVLTVDVSNLPNTFENPPVSRAKTALDVATVIMGCWTGA